MAERIGLCTIHAVSRVSLCLSVLLHPFTYMSLFLFMITPITLWYNHFLPRESFSPVFQESSLPWQLMPCSHFPKRRNISANLGDITYLAWSTVSFALRQVTGAVSADPWQASWMLQRCINSTTCLSSCMCARWCVLCYFTSNSWVKQEVKLWQLWKLVNSRSVFQQRQSLTLYPVL